MILNRDKLFLNLIKCSFLVFLNCNSFKHKEKDFNKKEFKANELIGEFYSRDSLNLLELSKTNDYTLTGKHCFVSKRGNKIDCCDKDSFVLDINSRPLRGKLNSCYNSDSLKVELLFSRSFQQLNLIFIEKNHEFLRDTIQLFKTPDAANISK